MKGVFRDDGHDVDQAADAAAGLQRVQRGDVAAVVLALERSNASALEFLDKVNGLPEPPPVVYVSATTELEVANSSIEIGRGRLCRQNGGAGF